MFSLKWQLKEIKVVISCNKFDLKCKYLSLFLPVPTLSINVPNPKSQWFKMVPWISKSILCLPKTSRVKAAHLLRSSATLLKYFSSQLFLSCSYTQNCSNIRKIPFISVEKPDIFVSLKKNLTWIVLFLNFLHLLIFCILLYYSI